MQQSTCLGGSSTLCKIAAKRLLNKALQLRKEHAGALLKTTRAVNGLNITGRDDFGVGCHTTSSEPYFYDSAYRHVQRACAVPTDDNGRCVIAKENRCSEYAGSKGQQPGKWHCSSECKAVTETEIAAIVRLKQAFEEPMQKLRNALDACDDGCPNQHYTKSVARGDSDNEVVDLQDHPPITVCCAHF